MNKTLSIIAIFLISFVVLFSTNIYAASLTGINITTTKEKVHPEENVTVDIEFGEELGSYTFDIAYDNSLFEYVSAEGGTSNDDGTKVRTYFFDSTGGTNPRSNMSVTFKAKDVTTSNPTNFSITAEGLANPDASVVYDDITTPIIKDIVVEPNYTDYSIKLNYTGDVIKNEEKDMKIVISSAMGKNYEHTRIIAEATTPSGATTKLLATDSQGLEHDIIQSGWGDAQGNPIGGKDVLKELNVRGLFSDVGTYTITLKLINRDDSDSEIAKNTFEINVREAAVTTPPETEDEETQKPEEKPQEPETDKEPEEETPSTLPQTGNMIYWYTIPTISILALAYIVIKKKD